MNIGKWNDPQLFEFNIFEYASRGLYIYLGENYPYNGEIIHKAKGHIKESVIGKWTNGERMIYDEQFIGIDSE